MRTPLPASWRPVLAKELRKPYFRTLGKFIDGQRRLHTVYPPEVDVFAALRVTPYTRVKVLLLGQDPYPGAGQAHGLSFSVRPGTAPPASLRNIYRELETEFGFEPPNSGYLVPWARQGVLLLNAVLTVRAGEPNSHRDRGWERFTDAIIRSVNAKRRPVVFVLWGRYAQKKAQLLDTDRHVIVEAAHPSPLSADKGFFGSRTFSKVNEALRFARRRAIDWQIPSV